MVVRLMNVENIDSYWKRVSQSLSLGDSFLRGKAEYDEELKAVSAYEAGKTVGNIMDRAEYEYETSYRPLPNYVPMVVPQGVRDQIIKDLREFIEWEGSEVTGIYKCVW